MMQLVYCIQREDQVRLRPCPQGIDGTDILHFVKDGLAAVYSQVPSGLSTPDVPQLLAYARVVEDLFRQGSLLPMRYGCLLNTSTDLDRLLSRNQQAYHLKLEKLDGCVEMGVRVLPARTDPSLTIERQRIAWKFEQQSEPALARSISVSAIASGPGISYLASRKHRFEQDDSQKARGDDVALQLQSALEGLFVMAHREPSTTRQVWLASIHFLVRGEFVERFRAAFRRIEDAGYVQLLMTGPWPPYNFVA